MCIFFNIISRVTSSRKKNNEKERRRKGLFAILFLYLLHLDSPKRQTVTKPTVTTESNVKISKSDCMFLRFLGWVIHILNDSGLKVPIKVITIQVENKLNFMCYFRRKIELLPSNIHEH